MTILEAAIVAHLGTSIAGGLTWDLIKDGGKHLIQKFQEKFVSNNSFENIDECNCFMQEISTLQVYNEKLPFRNVEDVHMKITEKENTQFIELFKTWLDESAEELKTLANDNARTGNVYIQNQTNSGSGTIYNGGVITIN